MFRALPSRRIVVPWTRGSRLTFAARRRVSGASAETSPENGRTRIEIAPASPWPGPVICDERTSFPATIGDDRGICSSVRLSVSSEIAGSVSAIRRPADAQNQSSGRRMIRPTQRSQNSPRRSRPGRDLRRMRPRSTRRPRMCRSAGRRVDDARTATVTTIIAPAAIDWTARTGTSHSASSARTTVRPENTTAVPEVRIAVSTASSGSAPAASSSRNRASTNIE